MESLGPQCLEVSLVPIESIPSNGNGGRVREGGAGEGAPPGGQSIGGEVLGLGLSGPALSSLDHHHHQAIRAAVASLQIHSSQPEQSNPLHTPLYTTAPLPDRSHLHSQHTSRPPASSQPYQPQTTLPPSSTLVPPRAPPDTAGRGPLVSQIWPAGAAVDGDALQSPHTTAPLAPHSTQGHGAPGFPPPPSRTSTAAGGIATVSAAGSGALGGVIGALDATIAATGQAVPPGHGTTSEIAHIGCAPHTHEHNLANSVPTAVQQQDNLQSFLSSSLQGGGVFNGGIPDHTGRRTQTSESGYSKATVLRPPSAIPIPPIPPTITSISLNLSQPNGAHPSFGVTNDGTCDHHHTHDPVNTAECNTPLVDSFTSPANVRNTANTTDQSTDGAHIASAAAYPYSNSQTQPESSRSAAQVASSRIATIANVMTTMNLPDTTSSPSLNSPVLETPHTVSLSEPTSSTDDDCIPKAEIGAEGSHAMGAPGSSSTMYGQQDGHLIFS
ncbi:hypothetical protein A1Q2_05179 [Trichosporon asahii var. asahii CBS 8904]|uniref:Uncharacterized protein n=2 Tax=Trichosporon asahii var. asahii TaxID=189963 RepID=K1WG52_TRIAC|nr:hypothetical protein A1Q2_05179 [Trichosporon asahii var. asahii CBS 8904]